MNKSTKRAPKINQPSSTPTLHVVPTPPSPKTMPNSTVGLDLGDQHCYFCVLDHDGNLMSEGKVVTRPDALGQYFSSLPASRIAMETGTHSGWVSRLAESHGHEVIVANARELRKIHQNNRKNDRADARILARLARYEPKLLAPIKHRSAPMQADLATIRARDVLVRARSQCVNAARGLVKAMGGRLPKCSTPSFVKKATLHLPEELRVALQPMMNVIESLTEQIREYDNQIEALARERYPQTQHLQQITGVGALTALAFLLTLADPYRFRTSRDVGAYLGLIPRQADSGGRVSQLGITKAGDTLMRRLLVNCAQYILGPFGMDSDLRRYGERLMQRGGKNAKKRAVVAVARKLAVLLHHLWITGEVYDALRNSGKAALPEAIAA
jgi:transposase